MLLKRIISVISAFAVCMSLMVFKVGADKQGTAIRTASQLMNMKSDGNYYLANDIDLSGVKWRSIRDFSGHFDGNGYEITGLTSRTYGLFADLDSGAAVENVKLTNTYITSKYQTVGGIVSIIQSYSENVTLDNCFVSGVVASCRTKFKQENTISTAGSIVGKNNSSSSVISNCYSNAVVASERTVGGIAGVNHGTIKNCGFGGQTVNSYNVYELAVNDNEIKTDEYEWLYCAGGICGFNYGGINNCSNNSTCLADSMYCGGIVGVLQPKGNVNHCVNSYDVHTDEDHTGMIAGFAAKSSDVSDCYYKDSPIYIVSKDIGTGKTGTVTYNLSAEEFGDISNFSKLGDNWCIVNGAPALKSLKNFMDINSGCKVENGSKLS